MVIVTLLSFIRSVPPFMPWDMGMRHGGLLPANGIIRSWEYPEALEANF